MHHYCPSVTQTSSISNKSANDPAFLNKYSINALLRSLFCSLIAFTNIKMHTPLRGHVVVGVVEVVASILSHSN